MAMSNDRIESLRHAGHNWTRYAADLKADEADVLGRDLGQSADATGLALLITASRRRLARVIPIWLPMYRKCP